MRLLLIVCVVAVSRAEQLPAEKLIEAGHWKQARLVVQDHGDALSNFLLSQIRAAFGDRATPLTLAEKAVALDGRTARYHRQVAEVLGVAAQHAGAIQQLFLARRFRREIDAALALDPRDLQSLRDLLEFYLLAPGIAGGDQNRAIEVARRIAAIDAVEGFLARARIGGFQNQIAAKEVMLRQAAESQPPRYKALIALAQFYLEAGHSNLSAAEEQGKAAMNLDPGRVDAYALLAVIYADRSSWGELDSTLAAGLREVPDDPVPYYRAAVRLLAAGRDPIRAERYLRVYLAQEPEGNEPLASEARWRLGLALEAKGQAADALAEFKESVRLDPESKAAQEIKHLRVTRPAVESNSGRYI
jgi:tetratricopeptide (TPR) repeat protein